LLPEDIKPELLKLLGRSPDFGSVGIELVFHDGYISRLISKMEVSRKPRTGGGGACMTPIQTGEQIFLAQMMISGNPMDYPLKFSDPRHREIYNHLAHLQTVSFHPGVRNSSNISRNITV
jgi:hypothetical protein